MDHHTGSPFTFWEDGTRHFGMDCEGERGKNLKLTDTGGEAVKISEITIYGNNAKGEVIELDRIPIYHHWAIYIPSFNNCGVITDC